MSSKFNVLVRDGKEWKKVNGKSLSKHNARKFILEEGRCYVSELREESKAVSKK